MSPSITGISSMATRLLLADLAAAYQQQFQVPVQFESLGGVEAAKKVQQGEAVDLVVLASDAIDKLEAGGFLQPASRRDLVQSSVAIAVQAGAPLPDVSSEAALRESVLAARSIGYSTGPSGTALLKLFERWGLSDTLKDRLVQARPGVPVGSLVAQGEVALGFQQLSELKDLPGITLLGGMPPGLEIVTTFTGAVRVGSTQPVAAQAVLDFMGAPAQTALKQRHGMEPAGA